MDALSELLRVVKLTGAMFFHARCGVPWGVSSPPSEVFGRHVGSPSSHIIEFHLLSEGRGYVRVGEESMPLSAGDVILMPHGDPHYLGSGPGYEHEVDEEDMRALLTGQLTESRLGGDGEGARLICGYLASEKGLIQPLLDGLPRVVRVNIRADAQGAMLESMIRHAVDQASGAAPGSRAIVAHLAEVLFAEVLRRYLLHLSPSRTGWLAGAADPVVGRALVVLHQRPGEPWTIDRLAREVGLSSSALTERFSRCLGQGPMGYLANWRLELAAESLRTTNRSVLQIAGEVGYESEAAFNRAFKRRFEAPPARYRREWRAGDARRLRT
ncbi:AraC family transcriptional regulator [Luteitalea sp. TBR-22]|uniref:AraC family transcriptional regulator n=1 Tax=Luteitalea sp. TBR-22 TaxID=2802971 RepID=UPI001AF1CB9A|nr:AraC family transcriptional regulator [Luteitalea sp. TBR-22]BCS31711.1 AraC family transcriptional regulator [Luteitalea sp. TBR-22]